MKKVHKIDPKAEFVGWKDNKDNLEKAEQQLGMLTILYTGTAIYATGGRQLCAVNWMDCPSEFFKDLLDGYRCHTPV